MIGRSLGQFRIVEQLGVGGMGVVYRAHDERLRRDVAIKILPPGALTSEASRQRFRREALTLSQLNHPAIATLHAFESAEGMDFLVMEYIPGESLDRRVKRGPLPESEVVALGLQVAEGLAAAHREDVIHRDLKPANLRVTPDGRLKILDFGLARSFAADVESTSRLTDPQEVVGTAPYIAPELLRGAPAGESSDLYSLGTVFYELSTGSLPFPGLTGPALFHAILNLKPPGPRQRNPEISAQLEALILRCMDPDPSRRYGSASELLQELRLLQSGSAPVAARARGRHLVPVIVVAGLVLAAVVAAAMWPRPIRSLAVLPLANLSKDPALDYFADGMTEELITRLAQIRSRRVTSRTSVMRYKNTTKAVRQIARELGVDAVVEGSVLWSGQRVRISAKLIRAAGDEDLWAESYEGDLRDIFSLQARVAQAIAERIRIRLSEDERARLAEAPRVDSLARDLYLRGRYHWNKRTGDDIRLAVNYFDRAVARDSGYALAYAGLADAWTAQGLYGLVPPHEALPHAKAAALKAIALDDQLSEAHASLGNLLQNFEWDWNGAEREYRLAIALNPSNADAHHWRGFNFLLRGRFAAAAEEIRAAQRLDPLFISIAVAGGALEYFSRHYEAALVHYRQAAEIDSNSALVHRVTAGAYALLGERSQVVRELRRSFELDGQPALSEAFGRAYADSGFSGAGQLLIAALIRRRAEGYVPAEHIAELYALLGRKDEALHWLEIGYREGDTELNRLQVDPIFDPLRGDPRYADLLRRVGLAASPAPS